MDKKRIEIIITSGLILIFILVLMKNVKVFKKKPSSIMQAEQQSLDRQEMPKQQEEKLEWGRDPFSGKVYYSGTVSGDTGELSLNGIIWDEKSPVAMINDRIVKVGDRVGVNTIIDIKKDRVILSNGIKTFELRL